MELRTDVRPWVECPYCDTVGLHLMRAPNPEPPRVVVTAAEQDEIITRSWDGRISVHFEPMDKYDRDDERSLETVRTCVECKREWGIVPTGQRDGR